MFARLANKHVLVTGASSGIGAAAAALFLGAGAHVTAIARRSDRLSQLVQTAASTKGASIVPLSIDVTDRDSVSRLPRIVGDRPVDILVNNAGGVRGVDRVGDVSLQDIDTMIDLNVKSLMHISQVFLKEFKARNAGHIINVGSIAGREAYPGGSVYCASKAAVRSFTEATLKECYDTPIRISEVQPGMVETEFSKVRFRGDSEKAAKVYKGIQALSGQDVAEEILWIASRPPHVNIAELFILPTNQASPTLVHRNDSK